MEYLVKKALLDGDFFLIFDQGERVERVPAKREGYVRLESRTTTRRAEIAEAIFEKVEKEYLRKVE